MTTFKDQTLLVTGASGHFGRLAVEELLARGATNIVAGTRDPSKLADLAAKGVEVRRLDFDDATSLGSGFAGVDRALVISTDGVGRRAEQQAKAHGHEDLGKSAKEFKRFLICGQGGPGARTFLRQRQNAGCLRFAERPGSNRGAQVVAGKGRITHRALPP